MQQIERYGVIALVFLLVTIVAVSFWGDSKSPGFWSRLTGRGAKKDAVAAQTTSNPETGAQASQPAEPAPATGERALAPELPLSPASTPAAAPTTAMTSSTPSTTAPATVTSQTTALYQAPPPPAPAANPASTTATPMASKPVVASAPRAPAPVAHTMNATTAPASSSYTVQKGDSLMRIAAKTLGSKERWTEIRDVNHGVDPHSLHVGQKLVIPASAKAGADAKHVVPAKKPATAPAEKPASGSADTYLVKKGDTLKSIAERHLGSRERWKEIASANPKVDPHHLAVGMSIKLPHAKSSGVHAESKEEPALAAATPHEIASGHPHVR